MGLPACTNIRFRSGDPELKFARAIAAATSPNAASPLWLAWWPPTFVVFLAFAVVVASLLCQKKGKSLPDAAGRVRLSRPTAAFLRDFEGTRRAAYFAYCRDLLHRRDHKAAVELHAGLASGKLTPAKQAALEKAVADYDAVRYGWRTQLRARWSSLAWRARC